MARLIVISGPSGAGKTTIVSRLLELRPALQKSISVTTRPARANERDGIDYRFISMPEFETLRDSGALLEWANVHGNWYGTPRLPVEEALATGRTVVLEIDVQGARSVRTVRPDALLLFVEPPSPEILRRRLEGRGTESEQVLERRLADSARELEAAAAFDHRITNDDVEDATSQVIRILEASPSPR